MVRIYTLTLAPSLDSATITPQIYPEGKLRCSAPVFEPGGGGINVARAIAHLGGTATAIFPAGGATGEHLVALLADENVPVVTVDAKDWTRQNLHVHVESSGEQYRFVMPGATLDDDEFRQLEEQVLEIESGAILVISGSLPPGVKVEKLTQLISAAQKQGIRCIIDSSGDALSTTPQPNTWQRRWSTFFAEQRIGWQLELAAEKGITFGNIDAIVEHVQQRLASHQPQPSLLHGDLWSANCALGPDGPYIFDPACYWGDRECDLAMLPLHTDQPPQIYDGYQSVSPLPLDFLDRQPIYQLYTLLNRARLFGGQQLVIAQKAMDRLLAV